MSNENLKSNQSPVGVTNSRLHFESIIKNHKGITLIALIITIIVMMILVAVSVTVALNGGLFSTAKKAASDTQIKAEEEMLLSAVVGAIGKEAKVDLGKLQLPDGFNKVADKTYESPSGNIFVIDENGEIENISKENDTNGVVEVAYEELTEELKTAMDEGKITKVLKEVKYGMEMQAVIPAGFEVSTNSGENTISGGLVVSDANGNEFVWVPCTTDKDDTSRLTQYAQDTQYNDGTTAKFEFYYLRFDDWEDEGGNKESVSKYGGFYVGRYEAGIPSDAPFYANTDGAEYIWDVRNTTAYMPVSKPNNPSWNWISQANAKIVSEAMYSDSESVESSLIDSYAWDTIVNWMESKNPGIAINSNENGNFLGSGMSLDNALYASHVLNYSGWKWTNIATEYKKGKLEIPVRSYDGEQVLYELATGTTEKTKILNIYDMAGNMWEFTTETHQETSTMSRAMRRGGGFEQLGSQLSHRCGDIWTVSRACHIGFRTVLYVK